MDGWQASARRLRAAASEADEVASEVASTYRKAAGALESARGTKERDLLETMAGQFYEVEYLLRVSLDSDEELEAARQRVAAALALDEALHEEQRRAHAPGERRHRGRNCVARGRPGRGTQGDRPAHALDRSCMPDSLHRIDLVDV